MNKNNKNKQIKDLQNTVKQLKSKNKQKSQPNRTANIKGGTSIQRKTLPRAKGAVFSQNRTGVLRVEHREPVHFVTTEGAKTTSIALAAQIPSGHALTDPIHVELVSAILGVSASLASAALPYLASLAARFAKGCIHGLELEFVPGNGTEIKGNVSMGFNPDPSDQPPSTPAQVTQLPVSSTTQAWNSTTMRIPKKYLGAKKYNQKRTKDPTLVAPAMGAEARQEGYGNFFIAVPKNDGTGNPVDGTFYLKYVAELEHPVMDSNGVSPSSDDFLWDCAGVTAVAVNGIYPFKTGPPANPYVKSNIVDLSGIKVPTLVCTTDCDIKLTVNCSGKTKPLYFSLWNGSSWSDSALAWTHYGDGTQSEVETEMHTGDWLFFKNASGAALDGYNIHIDCSVKEQVSVAALSIPTFIQPSYPRTDHYDFLNISFVQNTDAPVFGVNMASHEYLDKFSNTVLETYVKTKFDCVLIVDKTAITPVLTGYVNGAPLAPTNVADTGALAIFVWQSVAFDTNFIVGSQDAFGIQNTSATVNAVTGNFLVFPTRGTIEGAWV